VYLSLVDSVPVGLNEPLVVFDVSDAVLEIPVSTGHVDLQQVSDDVAQLRGEVIWEFQLQYRQTRIHVLTYTKVPSHAMH